jgi:hypothetical protein
LVESLIRDVGAALRNDGPGGHPPDRHGGDWRRCSAGRSRKPGGQERGGGKGGGKQSKTVDIHISTLRRICRAIPLAKGGASQIPSENTHDQARMEAMALE